jgi:hypothetical protein
MIPSESLQTRHALQCRDQARFGLTTGLQSQMTPTRGRSRSKLRGQSYPDVEICFVEVMVEVK